MNEDRGNASVLSRRLAAIMFADMVGYTALLQRDEEQARVLRNKMRTVLDKCIPEYGGTIIQYYGDGMVCMFGSGARGVQCAIAVQQEMRQEPEVPLRMGLHSGDVCYDIHGAYGDCVNVASRIEALASPGSVLVSDKVFDEIKNRPEIPTRALGSFRLKNVKRRVEVFAVINEGLTVPDIDPAQANQDNAKSIAVLPFANLSADPENEYFSDGISEEILNALNQVDGIRVCSRSSTYRFKGQHQDIREIGKKLNVSAILEGSVRRGGNKVRISARLVNAEDGYQIFSEVFDGKLDDIFRVQDEIASRIVLRMQEKYAASQHPQNRSVPAAPLIKPPTQNIDAYHIYLKGRYHWNQSTPEGIHKAIHAFEQAIELDPSFASAYCMLASCYAFMGSAGLMVHLEAVSKAKDNTLKALEIDPDHAEAHLALASIKFMQQWDFAGAEASLQKAVDLGLNSSLLNQVYGMLLIALSRYLEAVDRIEEALKQEPLNLSMICLLGDAYAFARRYDDALAQYDKVLEMDPRFRRACEGKGFVCLATGDYHQAVTHFEQYQQLIGHPLKGFAGLAYAYARAGQPDKALECLEKTRQREASEPGIVLDMDFAIIHAGLGDYDRTFYYMQQMYASRSNVVCLGMIYCLRFPILEEIKSDTRYAAFVEQVGLS